jgi:DNA-binding HxlR family transcriptional regulator
MDVSAASRVQGRGFNGEIAVSSGPVVPFRSSVSVRLSSLEPEEPPIAPSSGERSPVEITATILRGRWTALVVWHLFWGEKRFYQLLRETEGINRRALAHELEQLERLGLVERRVRHLGPAKVQYALTALGESLKLVVGAMYEWGLLARRRLPAAAPALSLLESDAR